MAEKFLEDIVAKEKGIEGIYQEVYNIFQSEFIDKDTMIYLLHEGQVFNARDQSLFKKNQDKSETAETSKLLAYDALINNIQDYKHEGNPSQRTIVISHSKKDYSLFDKLLNQESDNIVHSKPQPWAYTVGNKGNEIYKAFSYGIISHNNIPNGLSKK